MDSCEHTDMTSVNDDPQTRDPASHEEWSDGARRKVVYFLLNYLKIPCRDFHIAFMLLHKFQRKRTEGSGTDVEIIFPCEKS